MMYRGYLIKPAKAKGMHGPESAWEVWVNDKLKGIFQTLKEAKDFVDVMTKGTLYRPARHHGLKKTEFDEYKKVMEGNGRDKNRGND